MSLNSRLEKIVEKVGANFSIPVTIENCLDDKLLKKPEIFAVRIIFEIEAELTDQEPEKILKEIFAENTFSSWQELALFLFKRFFGKSENENDSETGN